MTFVPHFVNLMSKRRLQATVVYGRPLEAGLDRKRLAQRAHEEASRLRREYLGAAASPGSAPGGAPAPEQHTVPSR